jgi:hypothetical protein
MSSDVAHAIVVTSYIDMLSDVAHVIVVMSYVNTSSDIAPVIVEHQMMYPYMTSPQ